MMKIPERAKMNNRGLTLLEILVSIAIFAIVAVPLLNSFIVGMRVNNKARETEDAQQVAQNVAEIVDATDLNTLFEQMNKGGLLYIDGYEVQSSVLTADDGTDVYDDDKNREKYQLQFNTPFTGDGNEKYYVSATLSSSDANWSDIPKIVDIGKDSASTLRVCEQYYEYDSDAKAEGYNRKKTTFNIECTYADNKYKYVTTMNIEYYKTAGTETKNCSKTFTEVVIPELVDDELDLFLLCDYFDIQQSPSTDQVEINYTFNNGGVEGIAEKNCNVYFVGQEKIKAVGGAFVSFSNLNVNVKKNGYTGMSVFTNVSGLTNVETTSTGRQNLFNVYDLAVQVRDGSVTGPVVATVRTTITR